MISKLKDYLSSRAARSWQIQRLHAALAHAAGRSQIRPRPALSWAQNPYDHDAAAPGPAPTPRAALMITARYRSGSTFLWQLMNAVDGMTCFYEPLNERIWAEEIKRDAPSGNSGSHDPTTDGSVPNPRGPRVSPRVDPSHHGAQNYAAQYAGFDTLAHYHSKRWATQHLWMDEASHDWKMHAYLSALIDGSAEYPVLQFNRADFRLRWLRHHFPAAKFVHLIRAPRDQWVSSLYGQTLPHDISIEAFAAHDRFYLGQWADDLSDVFPILRMPPGAPAYGLFYLLWRLSCLHGMDEADLTIRYEDLLSDIPGQMEKILSLTNKADLRFDADQLRAMAVQPQYGKWQALAPADWFAGVEREMDAALSAYLR